MRHTYAVTLSAQGKLYDKKRRLYVENFHAETLSIYPNLFVAILRYPRVNQYARGCLERNTREESRFFYCRENKGTREGS